ncbi:pyruvate kinase [Mycoplasma tauri]|uniref:Pyruvate kinase n=1 Tax=Mycoplasma tauri TaxID=547987 RepID=A0A953T9L5_9MOLU|nr:pyruvate kinase [Mycoplasma tauri]MBZ4195389.1 pyruvate kinase [Mycoplasma tauri]MBZ4203809.1 pyruvate kinase [Mycoplasma tauri]MBZ4204151.1 pyruvate kinase [Mycoplasma tauri]MBZ4218496.1 pyruvate kinase [Mycoplasma tauri]MBZ4226692.1 pyruvate kinase [Mycoplasma tauri]
MNLTNKRSKLVVTIGPSTDNYNTLRSLIEAGATCVRTNFSHGTHEEHLKKFNIAKQISKDMHLPISLMLDTKGPEIRVGKMKDGIQTIPSNHIFKIHTTEEMYKNFEGTCDEVTVSYDMSKDLRVDNIILFDDGKLTALVTEVGEGYILAKTLNTHKLKTNKRINLPGVDFSLPFLSQKDVDDIKFGIEQGINYIAASFVNSAQNVNELRRLLKENNASHIQIISKIESDLGVKNINEIIDASDGIMVARGDLGLEIPYYDVPYFEKMMIRKCREAGKPVIVATQMLDSMESNPHPTRAEVTDVYYATELGADATMLSGETASGSYPLEAVLTMSNITRRAELEFYDKNYYDSHLEEVRRRSNLAKNKRARIAYDVANRTRYGEYKFAVVLSRTGKLLKEVAKFRPNTIIIGIVEDERVIPEFGVTSSVWVSLDSKKYFSLIKEDKSKAIEILEPYGVEKGDMILVVENESLVEKKVK